MDITGRQHAALGAVEGGQLTKPAERTGRPSTHRRDGLAEIGLRYPDPAPWFGDTYLAHHPVVHAVARRDAGELARARDFLVAARDAAGDHDTVLLSAEPVYRHVPRG